MSDTPTWLTITQLVASPLLGAVGALIAKSITERDKIRAHVDWVWGYSEQEQNPFEYARLSIQNLSDHDVYISAVNPRMGFLHYKLGEYTAMPWGEDYDDGPSFPYKIEKGQFIHLSLNSDYLGKLVKLSGSKAAFFGKLWGRPRIKIQIALLSGSGLRVSGEDALEMVDRAPWYRSPWWRLEARLPEVADPLSVIEFES